MDVRKVRFQPRRPDWAGDPDIMTGARYQHRLTRSLDLGAGRVEPVWSPMRLVNGSPAEMDLPVTPLDMSWAVEVYGELPDGRGGLLKTSEVVAVPAGSYSTILDFEDLVRLDPKTLGPVTAPTSAWEERLAAVEDAVAGGVGTGGAPAGSGTAGRLKIADVEDSTVTGQAVVKAANAGAALTAIGAAPAAGTTAALDSLGAAVTALAEPATATKSGPVELATVAETVAGTDGSRASTPAGVAAAVAAAVGVSALAPIDADCPGDVQITRPTTDTARRVNWRKATAPALGGYPNAEPIDTWEIWDA